ncbi:collagenase [Streptomyces sp. DW4-2]|uniref:microbial collagenase n=2 Tax=Streptomyces spirodelae TaxID=2812904 RepID=A0ABS3WVC1_9ACTN|nr:collagenase [Streptomyces spirodelae]
MGAVQFGDGGAAAHAAPRALDRDRDLDRDKGSGPHTSDSATRAEGIPEHTPKRLPGRRLHAEDRPPASASKHTLQYDHNDPTASPSEKRPSMKGVGPGTGKAACSPGDFAQTGKALVEQITSSTTECINTLFGLTGGDAKGAFREEQMITVADALRDGSATYPGDAGTGMPQIVLFLRAGYYVQYNHEQDVGEYGPELKAAIQRGLDAFFGSEHSHDVTDANGETLSEAVTLIDSAGENARYLGIVKRMLEDYDSSYDDKWWMVNAVNNVYTVLWRGHQMPDFVKAVVADPSVLRTLYTFAKDHLDLLGGQHSYLTSNAGREMGRFVQHGRLHPKVRPQMKALLKMSSMTGRTAPLWVGVAEMADEFDDYNCYYYGVCDLEERLKKAVLKTEEPCSDSISVVAQDMDASNFADTCTSLNGQDAFFHKVAKDDGPVKDDRNTQLEVVVFDSDIAYRTYAGVIYDIDTNNGGMYLEGDPSAEGNLPRFIAFERPDGDKFRIWNLNHEYTHYLDGRFDMYGDFEAGVSTPTVWWIEGFAEYISYTYRGLPYDEAIKAAGKKTYPLSKLFDTTYENSNTARTYQWGYLAVRYMLEKHPDDVATVLASYRTGDWNAARRHLTENIGTRYDQDWYTWLDACASGSC